MMTPEGRIVNNGDDYSPSFSWEYDLKDHLGNVRVVVSPAAQAGYANVLQQTHYYPFGMRMSEISTSSGTNNRYLYNGKEMQDDFGLNMYDYGARFYDPSLGRWHSVDPLAEKYLSWSPYNYTLNNPIKYLDPDGNDILIFYVDNGQNKSFRFNGSSNGLPNNTFVKSVVEAWNYNVGNGGGDPSFEAATNSDIEIKLNLSDQGSGTNKGEVYWNPERGIKTENGAVLSPATILDHELDHAVQSAKFGKKQMDNDLTYDKNNPYNNKEEQRVITGSEQKTALKNNEIKEGEVTRTNHSGKAVITYGVTSIKINATKTNEHRKKQLENHYNWTSEP
jgi:RHS repeat-associated protein